MTVIRFMVTRVLVILFCNQAYFSSSDGTTSPAPSWNDSMCQEIAKANPVLGDPSYCYIDHKRYTAADKHLCQEKAR